MLSAFARGRIKRKMEGGGDKKMGKGSEGIFAEVLSLIRIDGDRFHNVL